jgi:NAD(P)-dependent dehydrogenase (short-subunit alcohol dehydrogenase family)
MTAERVAIVTGGAQGIGRSASLELARRGYAVAVNDLRPAEETVREIEAAGGEAFSAPADVSDEASVVALVGDVERRYGRIDVLVNNAGIYEPVSIGESMDVWHARWARTMQINLQAAADLCRFAVSHFRARAGGGRIVNVASRAAYRGDSPEHWHYAASKAGLIGITKTIARGFAAEEIYAFAVTPGFTMTGMAEDYLTSRGGDKVLAEIPLGRVAMPEEVANAIAYLALSAPAAMTGAVLDINGASYVR